MPSSQGQSLLFPVSIKSNDRQPSVFRKIKSINEDEKSITFDGVVPEGSYIKNDESEFRKPYQWRLSSSEKQRYEYFEARSCHCNK
jgi:hypothetical protein